MLRVRRGAAGRALTVELRRPRGAWKGQVGTAGTNKVLRQTSSSRGTSGWRLTQEQGGAGVERDGGGGGGPGGSHGRALAPSPRDGPDRAVAADIDFLGVLLLHDDRGGFSKRRWRAINRRKCLETQAKTPAQRAFWGRAQHDSAGPRLYLQALLLVCLLYCSTPMLSIGGTLPQNLVGQATGVVSKRRSWARRARMAL
jgi:hypothetical protein